MQNKYIAVSVENMCAIENLTGNQAQIFNHMLLNMDYDNYFHFSGTQKVAVCKKSGIAPQTLNNNISEMAKKDLIRPIGRNEFLINKKYAVKGIPEDGVHSSKILSRPAENMQELYDFADTLDRRKGYVYAIGHFTHSRDSKRDMSKAFYVGKSCSTLVNRLSSHTKREKGAEAIVIEFSSHGETDYAEKVLINHLKPSKNKELYEGYENEEYANVLLERFWDVAKVYETDSKSESMGLIYSKNKVEIE